MRATNCATPGYEIVRLTPRTVVLYELPSVLSRGKSTFSKSPAAHGREALAGACEDRTHPRGSSPLSPVLKTGGHTSTHLLPCERRQKPPHFFYLAKLRARPADITLAAKNPSPVVILQHQQRVVARGAERVAEFSQRERVVRFEPRLHPCVDRIQNTFFRRRALARAAQARR